MTNEIIYLFVYLVQISFISYACLKDNFDLMKKMIVVFLYTNMLITARSVEVFGMNINIGTVFLVNTYFMCYLLLHRFGVEVFLKFLNNVLIVMMAFYVILQPLLFLKHSYIEPVALHLDEFFRNRTPYVIMTFGAFYIGQTIHASSYKLFHSNNILLDFSLRLFICMQIQSVIYYVITSLYFSSINTAQLLSLFANGMIFRGVVLLVIATPICYWLQTKCSKIYPLR